jgi:hypothetical protein
MDTSELTPNTILLGERDYSRAIDLIIEQAQEELLIFDQDLRLGDYASVQRYEAIRQFLSQNPLSQLTMVLHQAEFLTTQCPRLFELLETYGHKMTVYITNDHAKIAKDCFVIADTQHYVRRIHVDQARFKYNFSDAETAASLKNRFNELLDETATTVSATQLGL